jgi:hypothetical protein
MRPLCQPRAFNFVYFLFSDSRRKKVKPEALRAPGGSGSQISRLSAYEGGKVVSPTHRPPLPPTPTPQQTLLVLISVTG